MADPLNEAARPLIDLIDTLRAHGVQRDLSVSGAGSRCSRFQREPPDLKRLLGVERESERERESDAHLSLALALSLARGGRVRTGWVDDVVCVCVGRCRRSR